MIDRERETEREREGGRENAVEIMESVSGERVIEERKRRKGDG